MRLRVVQCALRPPKVGDKQVEQAELQALTNGEPDRGVGEQVLGALGDGAQVVGKELGRVAQRGGVARNAPDLVGVGENVVQAALRKADHEQVRPRGLAREVAAVEVVPVEELGRVGVNARHRQVGLWNPLLFPNGRKRFHLDTFAGHRIAQQQQVAPRLCAQLGDNARNRIDVLHVQRETRLERTHPQFRAQQHQGGEPEHLEFAPKTGNR